MGAASRFVAGKAEDVEDGKVESQLKVGLKEVRPKMRPKKKLRKDVRLEVLGSKVSKREP